MIYGRTLKKVYGKKEVEKSEQRKKGDSVQAGRSGPKRLLCECVPGEVM